MTRVLSGAVLIALAVVVVWFAPRPVFELVAFALLFIATGELVTLFVAGGIQVPRWPAMIASLLTLATFSGVLAASLWFLTTDAVLMVALVGLGVVSMLTWRGGADALATVSSLLFPSLYIALPIGAIIAIREQGPQPLFLLMVTIIVSDTAQYYTGRLTGRHLLAPAISPKKTIEGAVGGLVFGTAVFAAVGAWWLPIAVPLPVRVGLGICLVAVGIAGDLFESMLKRSAGVKDSSALIPGHGGVLDRIDALLFAAPLFYFAGHLIRN
jgi:phosphatidate cytidylyltransferase